MLIFFVVSRRIGLQKNDPSYKTSNLSRLFSYHHTIKAKQQISKEYEQLKQIQQTLQLISMDIERNPYRGHNVGQASRPGDPASFFQQRNNLHHQDDLYLHDPDVWGPPPPVKDTKGGGRIGTANRKLDANKRNGKSATAAVAPIKRIGGKPLSRAGTAKAGTSKNGKENGDSNKNGGEKGDKSEKDDENEEEKTPERRFEAASHSDIDLVDMLGECSFYLINHFSLIYFMRSAA